MDTLDKLHASQIKIINDNVNNLPNLLSELDELTGYEKKLNIEEHEKVDNLKSDIKKIKKDKVDYYMKTGELLFQYYDNLEKGGNTTKSSQIKSIPGKQSIVSYFTMNENVETNDGIDHEKKKDEGNKDENYTNTFGKSKSREELRNCYLQTMEIQYGKKMVLNNKFNSIGNNHNICKGCNNEMTCSVSEGVLECHICGNIESYMIDTDKPSYRDPPKESSSYSYRRSNHFNEWIAQFQAKETTQIPKQVLYQIIQEIKKERIQNLSNLTQAKVRSLLKKLKLNKYYEHIPHIINQLNGKPPPTISRQTEETFRLMFQEIQGPFLEYCPKNRKNFLSYSYVLHKFVELLGLDDLKPLFPLLKSREKLHQQDQIWKKICEHIGWDYHKSM